MVPVVGRLPGSPEVPVLRRNQIYVRIKDTETGCWYGLLRLLAPGARNGAWDRTAMRVRENVQIRVSNVVEQQAKSQLYEEIRKETQRRIDSQEVSIPRVIAPPGYLKTKPLRPL